jgi:subtilisin family serine protease
MSNYSSFGPTADFRLKPQLSAPGEDILSTWSFEIVGYVIISGTSMSTPFMAGCYALIKSQRTELTVNEIYALIMNTGKPVPWLYDTSILSSATHQGAGLVNAYDALMSETLILPPQLNLRNDNFTVKANITISNRSNGSKTYALGHKVSHPS